MGDPPTWLLAELEAAKDKSLPAGPAIKVDNEADAEWLRMANIEFPALLGGCIFLFFFLLLTEAVNPTLANSIFEALSPGAAFLAKWLPPLFVPGLVMLPLSPSVGGGVEVSASEKR